MGNAIEYNDKMHFSQRAVWRKRGSGSPESLCGFGSFAPVRAAVKAPPAPSRRDVICKRRKCGREMKLQSEH